MLKQVSLDFPPPPSSHSILAICCRNDRFLAQRGSETLRRLRETQKGSEKFRERLRKFQRSSGSWEELGKLGGARAAGRSSGSWEEFGELGGAQGAGNPGWEELRELGGPQDLRLEIQAGRG